MTEPEHTSNFFCKSELAWSPPDRQVVFFSTGFDLAAYRDALFDEFQIPGKHWVHKAVNKRKAEFFAGRYAMKQAFGLLGQEFQGIEKGERGEPLLPEGLVGSISHSHSFAIAVLAHKDQVPLLGVDVENIVSDKSAQTVLKMVISDEEASLLEVLGRNLGLTVAFSAKESLYKALYPRVQTFFGFEAAKVFSVDPQAHCLELEITQSLSPQVPAGLCFKANYHSFEDRALTYISSQ